MIDFLDRVQPAPVVSRIHCDTDGCSARLMVNDDITERESVDVANQNGWTASMGTRRAFHHCARHADWSKR